MTESRFDPSSTARLVKPVARLDAKGLRDCLTKARRNHPNAGAFLAAVVDWCAAALDMASDVPALTTGDVRGKLEALEGAAHKMRNAMQELADTPDEFGSLHDTFDELQAITGRPAVQTLPELLRRLESDLQTLRDTCARAAKKIKPRRSPPEYDKRALVRGVAELHRAHFGELPREGGSFAVLMEQIGQYTGMVIGRGVVRKVVAELAGESSA